LKRGIKKKEDKKDKERGTSKNMEKRRAQKAK